MVTLVTVGAKVNILTTVATVPTFATMVAKIMLATLVTKVTKVITATLVTMIAKVTIPTFVTMVAKVLIANLVTMKLCSEINPTRCNNCVYSSQWLYSTCFG